jgi:hypothetical protein
MPLDDRTMKYPEVLLLPFMMFTDYFLTVLGAIQRDKEYALHFKTQHYELNPIWQKQIAHKKWFNPRHIILTILLSGILICLVEFGDMPADFAKGLLGCILVLYGMILGRHFSNLLVFSHLIRKPGEISGEVSMSHQFVLSLSLYQTLMVIVPILLVAIFSQSNFALGGVVGIILFLIINLVWIRKAKKQKNHPTNHST